MAFGKLVRTQPVWDIREYFAGLGYMMVTGAVLMNFAIFDNRGVELALWQLIAGYAGAASSAGYGLWAFWRFVTTSTKPATASILAVATTFASLLLGGLLGVFGVAALGDWLAT